MPLTPKQQAKKRRHEEALEEVRVRLFESDPDPFPDNGLQYLIDQTFVRITIAASDKPWGLKGQALQFYREGRLFCLYLQEIE